MDSLPVQAAMEQALNSIQSQAPDAIDRLIEVLNLIKSGAFAIWGISHLILKYPVLLEATNQLLNLLQSGASIPQIATVLAQWAAPLGSISQVLIDLLYWLSNFLLLF